MAERSRTGAGRGRNEYGSIGSASRRRGRRPRGVLGFLSVLGPVLYFPMMLFYLELVFHLYMRESIRYMPIWLFFSISMGFLLSLLAINFSFRVNRIITYVLTVFFSLIYTIEMMTKKILASYYQLFSIAGTAANNKLTDYMGAIIQGIVGNIFGILLMFLPVIFIFVIGRNFYNFKKKWIGLSGVVAGAFVVTHLLALVILHLPWSGEYKPKDIYATNTNLDDQVEQLGITTMLRLDLKHSIFGVKKNLDDDFTTPSFASGNEQKPVESSAENAAAGTEATGSGALFTNTDTSPNVMNVDLETLAANASNDEVSWLCKFFNSQTPTNKNKYTGAFKDYNVIFVTAEGLTGYGISEELTPTLWKMSHEGFVFNNFYTALHFTSTAGGECQNLLGLYPQNGGDIITQESGNKGTNWYFSLAQQLNRKGYNSLGFHANSDMYNRQASHTNLGYKMIQEATGIPMELNANGESVWPQSDLYTIENTIDQCISSQPFNAYYLTISGHMPYTSGAIVNKNMDLLANTSYTENTKGYLATVIELDRGMEYLLQKLEENGIADKTLVVLVPDHIPYFDVATMEELAGKTFAKGDTEALAKSLDEKMIGDYNLYKNTLIMWTGSMTEPVQVDKICCQVDVLPTISNLLGLEYDSRMLSGTDILSDSTPLVAFNSGCWLTDQGYYDRYTQTFTPSENCTLDAANQEEYVAAMKKLASNRREISGIALKYDAYDYIFPNTKNSSNVQ